jgi:hypothetical protein
MSAATVATMAMIPRTHAISVRACGALGADVNDIRVTYRPERQRGLNDSPCDDVRE